MRINGTNVTNSQLNVTNKGLSNDSVSNNIQNQLANAQKQLQDLSSNEEMSIEEKMKKRQEIQQQITDLNNQLRQHQIEQRTKKMQVKSSSMDAMFGGNRRNVSKAGNHGTGLSQASMRAIISADSAMAQVQVQESVASRMEGRAGVLKAEIKQDRNSGGNVETKQEELAKVEQKSSELQSAQMNTLAKANNELEAAAKEDRKAENINDKDTTTDKKEYNDASVLNSVKYTHVDVLL